MPSIEFYRRDRRKKNIRRIQRFPLIISFLAVATILFDFGFDQSFVLQSALFWVYTGVIVIGIISIFGRYFLHHVRPPLKVWAFDLLLLAFLVLLEIGRFGFSGDFFFEDRRWLYLAVFFIFIREFSALDFLIKKEYFNPARLFILSFVIIALLGALVLLLPNATYSGISFIDSLFTSTSAVCVTGLIVVDTGSYFTPFGQWAILALIQIGGLGIMTFTSYFTYFFRGGATYESQLMLKDITNAGKIAEVFGMLKRIILLTFLIEAIGAVIVFFSLDYSLFNSGADQIFFSIFHSISGFCNAGFSTLPNGLYETGFRFNYPLHLTLAFLFIIGGIGFPILFNLSRYIKYVMFKRISITGKKKKVYMPWIFNINTRIVLATTVVLIIAGTVLFYLFEYDNTLAGHSEWGKLVTAFFGGVTPRTAGFNTVDMTSLNLSTVMITFLLMWIGASPASTGGGIKTSTFAIGTLNFMSLARGKDRIEVFNREIADISVRRAFAIISLSLVVIGASVFFITLFDPDKELIDIAFEVFSAYSTVGLSLGITPKLSEASKIVIILTMFVGRVSMLTILIATFSKIKHLKYRYPSEEILIN